MQIYNWFGRWLKGDPAPVNAEPPVKPEPEQALWVSEAGSTLVSFHSETPLSLLKTARGRTQTAQASIKYWEWTALRPACARTCRGTASARRPCRGARCGNRSGRVGARVVGSPADRDAPTPVLLTLDGAAGREALWFQSEIDQVIPASRRSFARQTCGGWGRSSPNSRPARWNTRAGTRRRRIMPGAR